MAIVLLCAVTSLAGFGKASSASPQSTSARSVLADAQFAIADFDGDNRPDLATVQMGQGSSSNTSYWILFKLSTGLPQSVGVTAPAGGLRLDSRDVNGDSFLDLVVTTAWSNRPVAVLLNDGRGTFTRSDPSAFQGAFRTSDSSWIFATHEVKDAAAALLPRGSSGDCEETGDASSSRSVSPLVAAPAIHSSVLSRSVVFLGRAPPFLL